jgi:UMF1 family MFS transporter
MLKNDPNILRAWYAYDAANSAYSLTVTTAIFPPFFLAATAAAYPEGNGLVPFLGIQIKNDVLFSYSVSIVYLFIAVISPFLSGMADYGGNKKAFMKAFVYLGSLSCLMLYFFDGVNVAYAILFSMLAQLGFTGSIVFYNAFLPEIATADRMNDVSAKGFSWGYFGSVLILIVNLVIIENFAFFGFENSMYAVRSAFVQVGVWWMLLSIPAFVYLKDTPKKITIGKDYFFKGLRELNKVRKIILSMPTLKRYLFSFFFFSMGVQTIMLLAPLYGKQEFGMETSDLILTILIIQLVAIMGSMAFARLAKAFGNAFSLYVMLLIWLSICVIGYFLYSKAGFYFLAALVGTVMGGIQSLARATYSKLLPNDIEDTASFFSFYDVMEKLATTIGTLSFSVILDVTGSMRNSIFALGSFFILGIVLLNFARLPKMNDEAVH